MSYNFETIFLKTVNYDIDFCCCSKPQIYISNYSPSPDHPLYPKSLFLIPIFTRTPFHHPIKNSPPTKSLLSQAHAPDPANRASTPNNSRRTVIESCRRFRNGLSVLATCIIDLWVSDSETSKDYVTI